MLVLADEKPLRPFTDEAAYSIILLSEESWDEA